MKAQNRIVLIVVFALWPLSIRAQEPEAQTGDQPIAPPPVLNGQLPSLAFQSEKTPSNSLSGEIAFTDVYTDNALQSNTDAVGDFTYLIQPRISFSQATPRMNWDINVGAGFVFDQHIPEDNEVAKNVALDFIYRLTQHVSLRLTDTFNDTTGLFNTVNPSASDSGVVEQSNDSLLLPLVQRTVANTSEAELSYQFSPSSMVGVRGNYSFLDYPSSPPSTPFGALYDTQAYLGEAFYNRQLSPRQWVGVALRVQRFDTTVVTTDTDALLLYYSVTIPANVNLSFFAGPEYYNIPRISDGGPTFGLTQGHQWTSAEGATLSWQSERTSIAATFSRQLSDGAGLYPAVILTTVDASVRRQLGRGLEAKLGYTYAINDPLQTGDTLHGTSVLGELQQRFGNGFLVRAGYAWQKQQWPALRTSVTANIAWVSVSYSFSHLFGSGTSTKPAGRIPF
jgi:hypothetical protein